MLPSALDERLRGLAIPINALEVGLKRFSVKTVVSLNNNKKLLFLLKKILIFHSSEKIWISSRLEWGRTWMPFLLPHSDNFLTTSTLFGHLRHGVQFTNKQD